MKYARYLCLLVLLIGPYALRASESTQSGVKSKKVITFAPTTLKAFDHSDKTVIHKTLQDGSRSAQHQGTHGHVLVARMAADGSIETYCTTEESAASAWLAGEEPEQSVAPNHTPPVEN